MPDPLRLGVVGCARILPAHLRGLATLQTVGLDPVRITGLCSRRIEDAAMFLRRGEGPPSRAPASANANDPLGAPHVYVSDLQDEPAALFDDWRTMLEGDVVDAVLILTPVSLHHQVALDALAAGKHVLVEKPFAISVRAGQKIADEAKRRGLVAGVAETVRYAARTRALRWVLDQELIGRPQLWLSAGLGGEWSPDGIVARTPWRHQKLEAGGGTALDTGVHLMDQIRYLMGEVQEIGALARTLEPVRRDRQSGTEVVNETDDLYLAQLSFASGAVGSAVAGWAGRGQGVGLSASPVIYGTRGCIQGELVVTDDGPAGSARDLLEAGMPSSLREQWFPQGVEDVFALEMLDFTRAVSTGAEMEVSAVEGVKDLATAYAILESSQLGRPVAVDAVYSGGIAGYQADIDSHYALV